MCSPNTPLKARWTWPITTMNGSNITSHINKKHPYRLITYNTHLTLLKIINQSDKRTYRNFTHEARKHITRSHDNRFCVVKTSFFLIYACQSSTCKTFIHSVHLQWMSCRIHQNLQKLHSPDYPCSCMYCMFRYFMLFISCSSALVLIIHVNMVL